MAAMTATAGTAALPIGIALGTYAAYRGTKESMLPRTTGDTVLFGGVGFGAGLMTGIGTDRVLRAVANGGAGMTATRVALGTAGVVLAVAARDSDADTIARSAGTVGAVVAATAALGGAIDGVRHLRGGAAFPWEALRPRHLAIAGVVAGVGLLGWQFAPMVITAISNIGSAAAPPDDADGVGRALGELIPRSKVGQYGRMFLQERMTGLASEPVRTYVPLELDGMSMQERNALGVQSMVQQGAFNKSRIVVGSPTGTGHFNPSLTASDEMLADGDTAWVLSQYADKPSIVSLHRTFAGADTVVDMARQVTAKKRELFPDGGGPDIYLAATSLGSLTVQRALRLHGDELLGEGGIKRVLLVGTPEHLTSFDPHHMGPGRGHRTHDIEAFRSLSSKDVQRSRVIEYSHANDPVRLMDFSMAFAAPKFLVDPTERAKVGVADEHRYTPLVSLMQHGRDVVTSIAMAGSETAGSSHHDYRAELPEIVAKVFEHDASPERVAEVGEAIARRDSARVRGIREQLGVKGDPLTGGR